MSEPMYPCKAFVIDPFVLIINGDKLVLSTTPPIREVTHDGTNQDIYRRLSTPDRRVNMMEAVYLDGRSDADVMYADEEGLLHGPTHFIRIEGWPHPVTGRGYVLGTNSEGYSVAPDTSLEALWARTSIAIGNVEVELKDLPVGSPITADAVQVHDFMVVEYWAMQERMSL